MKKLFTAFSLSMLSCCLMAGCADTQEDAANTITRDHGHDHGHDHGDDGDIHGPFGGHVFSFDSDEYRGEWKHYNDNDVIRVYVLDSTGKKEAPVNGAVTLTPLAGADKTPFELEGENPNDDGETAIYSLDDKNLTIAITAAGVTVGLKVGDKSYEGVIEAHEPHDH
jgi:hypothetical protein